MSPLAFGSLRALVLQNPARLAGAGLLFEGELVLDPLVTHRVPFHDAARAYALVDEHPDETVQVVLTYD